MSIIYCRGSREHGKRLVRAVVGALVGGVRDPAATRIAVGVFLSVGVAALSDITADFVRKSRGQTGEDGNTWKPLSREYLAYGRRFGPGEKTALKRAAGLGRQHAHAPGNKDGLLSKAQLKRWRGIYSAMLSRFVHSMPIGEAKSYAAAIAWTVVKREGGQTKLAVFGSRQVDILRDTGVLLNSLSIGRLVGTPEGGLNYQKPNDEQIFESLENGVIIGTNVKYAAAHQFGYKGIPARPFLPLKHVPDIWQGRWLDAGMAALKAGLAGEFGRLSA